MRLIQHEYFEISDLPTGEIPYTAIINAIKAEEYLRKFTPTNYRDDFNDYHLAALLYWYPEYITKLYDLAVSGDNFMSFFKPFPPEIRDGFVYLFPEVMLKLKKVKKKISRVNHFEEIKI